MIKTIRLNLEDMNFEVVGSNDSLLIDLEITDSRKRSILVSPSVEEVKEIIAALVEILPNTDSNEDWPFLFA